MARRAIFQKREKLAKELEVLDARIYRDLSPVVVKFLRGWWEGSYGAPDREIIAHMQELFPQATDDDIMRVVERMEKTGRLERKNGYYDKGGIYYRFPLK